MIMIPYKINLRERWLMPFN